MLHQELLRIAAAGDGDRDVHGPARRRQPGAYAPGCSTGDRRRDRQEIVFPIVVADPS